MKLILTLLLSTVIFLGFSQNEPIDSTQYNIGYTIGQNIPVFLLMSVAVFFIIRAYRRKGEKPEKTDFMDDGTIDKDHFR